MRSVQNGWGHAFVCVTFFSRGAPEWVGGGDPNRESTFGGLMWGSKEGGGCMDARGCSEYDVNEAKKAIKGAFGDGVMASHQLGALLWPTTAIYYAKCYLCKSTKANNALQSHERPHVPRRRVSNHPPQQRLPSSTTTSQSTYGSLQGSGNWAEGHSERAHL